MARYRTSWLLCLSGAAAATATQLRLQYVSDPSVKCNDGSRPAYFVGPGDPRTWLIWLDGGFGCATEEDCNERAEIAPFLMTSTTQPETLELEGIFASDPENNRVFHGATKVLIHYCSSDSWLGDNSEPALGGRWFHGQRILTVVMRELAEYGLSNADLVVLGGASAGGRGALYNLDRVCGSLPNPKTTCRGYSDGGWWVADTGSPLEPFAKAGLEAWNGSALLTPCTATRPGAEHMCMFGPQWAPHVRTPFLVQFQQFDIFQLQVNEVDPVNICWWWWRDFAVASRMRSLAQETLRGLPDRHAAFSAGCVQHVISMNQTFSRIRVPSQGSTAFVSVEQALHSWLPGKFHNPAVGRQIIDTCDDVNCSAGCPDLQWALWRSIALQLIIWSSGLSLLGGIGVHAYSRFFAPPCSPGLSDDEKSQ